FWVAVDELIKAKNADPSAADKINDLLGQYSARFPNTEEAFFNGYTDGQTYTVGCWIGQNTIVRTRK
ncbi:MAG: tetratricopeptide repeat protein, partial [Bacteroidales bacterium]|nr:tetratricopeptide repeat protein [Bacteroidales bacterium]